MATRGLHQTALARMTAVRFLLVDSARPMYEEMRVSLSARCRRCTNAIFFRRACVAGVRTQRRASACSTKNSRLVNLRGPGSTTGLTRQVVALPIQPVLRYHPAIRALQMWVLDNASTAQSRHPAQSC